MLDVLHDFLKIFSVIMPELEFLVLFINTHNAKELPCYKEIELIENLTSEELSTDEFIPKYYFYRNFFSDFFSLIGHLFSKFKR